MRARGTCGELRVAYQQAAVLGAWTLEQESRVPRAYIFRARLVSAHDFWMTQQPIDLVLTVGTVEWTWRGVTVRQDGCSIIVTLTERPIVAERMKDAAAQTRRGAWR